MSPDFWNGGGGGSDNGVHGGNGYGFCDADDDDVDLADSLTKVLMMATVMLNIIIRGK